MRIIPHDTSYADENTADSTDYSGDSIGNEGFMFEDQDGEAETLDKDDEFSLDEADDVLDDFGDDDGDDLFSFDIDEDEE